MGKRWGDDAVRCSAVGWMDGKRGTRFLDESGEDEEEEAGCSGFSEIRWVLRGGRNWRWIWMWTSKGKVVFRRFIQ